MHQPLPPSPDLHQYVLDLVKHKAEENIYTEFKSGRALEKGSIKPHEIAKDVSAFANADGGRLFFGLDELDHRASSISYVDGREVTKEYLEQIINDNIQRKITGLIIDAVRMDGNLEKTVYIVTIPRSKDAPHKCRDGYYKRQNYRVMEMEEYEVRDSYHRVEMTRLSILEPMVSDMSMQGTIHNYNGSCTFMIQNTGPTIEKLYKSEIHFPQDAIGGAAFYSPASQFQSRGEKGYAIFSVPCNSPIFQNEIVSVLSIGFDIKRHAFEKLPHYPVLFRLYYTYGVEEYSFLLSEKLKINGRKVSLADFG